MSVSKNAARSILRRRSLFVSTDVRGSTASSIRCISSTIRVNDASLESTSNSATSSASPLDPTLLSTTPGSKSAKSEPQPPLVGSARRRAALRSSSNIPFEQLPYQCFQEARKLLLEDREEKLKQIATERERISRLQQSDPTISGGEHMKQKRLRGMQKHLERLKILADINDPLIKKRFEDGEGKIQGLISEHVV